MATQTGSIDLSVLKASADIAKNTEQYFWHNSVDSGAGEGAGAHITEVDQDTFISDPTNGGGNVLIDSDSVDVRDGTTVLATFGASGTIIGQIANDESRTEIGTQGLKIVSRYNGADYETAHLGVGETAPHSGIQYVPHIYHTLGSRDSSQDIGDQSFAEGVLVTASGVISHAEGERTTASGFATHAEGGGTTASGDHSHAQNNNTIATRKSQTAIGEFNIRDTTGADETERGDYVLIIGNGTSAQSRSNALTVDWDGNVEIAGSAYDGTTKRLLNSGDIVAEEHKIKGGLSVNNGSQSSGTATVQKANAYPLGIVGHRTANGSGSGGSYALPHALYISSASTGSATVSYGIRAVGGNVSNCDLYATILWKYT